MRQNLFNHRDTETQRKATDNFDFLNLTSLIHAGKNIFVLTTNHTLFFSVSLCLCGENRLSSFVGGKS